MLQRIGFLLLTMLLITATLVSGRTQTAFSTMGATASSSQPFMLGDLNQNPASSYPGPFVVVQDVIYYFASKGEIYYDLGLWRSDGTEAGTRLVKDLYPGYNLSSPAMLAVINDTFFFQADSTDSYAALWRSDGTEAGTTVLFDQGYVHHLTVLNETLYFFTGDYYAWQLWRSDGTEAGTTILKEVNTPYTYFSTETAVLDNFLYFRATHPTLGEELWRTDGTAEGTTLFKDLRPGDQSSSPEGLIEAGGLLYFSAYQENNAAAYELWRSNGTANGTFMVKNIAPTAWESSYPGGIAALQDKLLFSADDEIHGRELWLSDGAANGTQLLKDMIPGEEDGIPIFTTPLSEKLNEIVYFVISNGEGSHALWRTDATESGTYLIKPFEGYINDLTVVGDMLYLSADDGTHGTELWRSDGTMQGTTRWADIAPGPTSSYPSFLTPFNNGLIFAASDGIHGQELWWSSNLADTRLVADLYPATESSYPDPLIHFNDQVIFSANHDGSYYDRLWQTDGTNAPTPFPDLGTGPDDDYAPFPLFVYNHELFLYDNGQYWRTDGTVARTHFFMDMETLPDPEPSEGYDYFAMAIDRPVVHNGLLYFSAFFVYDVDGYPGYDFVGLYYSDGAEIHRLDADFTYVDWMVTDGRSLYLSAYTPETGQELWKSDGTKEGTLLVKDIAPNTPDFVLSSSPTRPSILNGILYFTVRNNENGRDLWRSDGTAKGTWLVKGSFTFETSIVPWSLLPTNQFLFFLQYKPDGSFNLWRSSGTTADTIELKQFTVPDQVSYVQMTALLNTLFLATDDGEHGYELWRSDGSVTGTRLVADIFPGTTGATPYFLTSARDGKLYFNADDGVHGYELWQSDGTAQRTRLVADIRPGPLGSDPLYFTDITLPGKSLSLLFSADDGLHGRELWTLPYVTFTNRAYLPFLSGPSIPNQSALRQVAPILFQESSHGQQPTTINENDQRLFSAVGRRWSAMSTSRSAVYFQERFTPVDQDRQPPFLTGLKP